MTDPLTNWRWMLRLAREGEPFYLLEAILRPDREWQTGEIDAEGKKVWRKSFRPIPDDEGIRLEIVEALQEIGRYGNRRRGRKPAIPARDVGGVQFLFGVVRAEGVPHEEALCEVARAFDCSVATVRKALDGVGPYDQAREEGKEARRLKRSAQKK